ncbi:endonuclease/exonuclease/phosphatase family protein [Rhodalgimonas zhirmunskyi]|uniref:Endonuclease/exonuclease/phosphatase family protein n=1 Tax=Rhodalgimonas zhirmunskyi TaxID=2964767 RepID=A0AAJ1UFH0_9RHOB|nr:endonuclease/exonuclease/phosphatase family protein [Rhodoalgimonas zhirmunskyi]MDQ2095276.1 endonuclease/exonuclease/phosphatase family protein [Rhodoalgimonas zhirmunskyi]
MTSIPFRVASYNLQKCVGLDLRRRPDRSLTVIEALDAQIVILQEADKRLPPRPAALPHEMAEAQGWRIAGFGQQGSAGGGSLGWHGNAMLLRDSIGLEVTHHIELPGLEPRGAICADLDTPIGPLRVVGAHLGLIRRYRLMQLQAIMRFLRKLPERPTVLAGDFNEWGSARALDVATHGLDILPERPSFPAPRPVAALDRFALSPELEASGHGAYSGRPARMASDHLPVWADLRLKR